MCSTKQGTLLSCDVHTTLLEPESTGVSMQRTVNTFGDKICTPLLFILSRMQVYLKRFALKVESLKIYSDYIKKVLIKF